MKQAAFPFWRLISPSLLMQGEPIAILWAVLTASLGIWMGTIGVVGHFYSRVSPMPRALFIIAGVSLMIPADAFRGAFLTDIAGLALGGVLLAREVFRDKENTGQGQL